MKKPLQKRFYLFVILIISLVSLKAQAENGLWKYYRGLDIEGTLPVWYSGISTGWYFFAPGDSFDAPEGGYYGRFRNGSYLDAVVPLGTTLPTGTYYVFFRGIDYDARPNLTIFAGNGQTTLPAISYRTGVPRATVTTTSAFNKLTFRFSKTAPEGIEQRQLILTIYITPDPNEIMGGKNTIISLEKPPLDTTSPVVKGNLLRNGSFETGIAQGWGVINGGAQPPAADMIASVTDDKIHGARSLKANANLNPGVPISYPPFRVFKSAHYTLSFWIKNPQAAANVHIYNSLGDALPPTDVSHSAVWKKVVFPVDLYAYPDVPYIIEFYLPRDTYLDAVQIEEGEAGTYLPRPKIEASFLAERPSKLFLDNADTVLRLRAFNYTSLRQTKEVQYKIYNYLNLEVKSGLVPVTIPADAPLEANLNLGRELGRGIFRILSWVKGEEDSLDENVFEIIPVISLTDADSNTGIHPTFNPNRLTVLKQLGFTSARSLSPGEFFRWHLVQPTTAEINWNNLPYDAYVNQLNSLGGMGLLASLGTNNAVSKYWPSWADDGLTPNLVKYEKWVEDVVRHFAGRIKYWETWNEPNEAFAALPAAQQPEFVAELIWRTAKAVRRGDPQAKVVGIGGAAITTYVEGVLQAVERRATSEGLNWKNYIDVISVHYYPKQVDPNGGDTDVRSLEIMERVGNFYNIPVWQTEAGVWEKGFYKGDNAAFVEYGSSFDWSNPYTRFIWGNNFGVERTMLNYLTTVGAGVAKYYYYDARSYPSANGNLSNQPTFFEHDDSIRAKGIAHAIGHYFVGAMRGKGKIGPWATVVAYLFNKPGTNTSIITVWSQDAAIRTLTVTFPVKVFDVMGNLLREGNSITFGRMPVYVQPTSLSLTPVQLKAAFEAGTLSNALPDNQAPGLSLDVMPIARVNAKVVPFRWTGLDDTSFATSNEPNKLTFSYKLAPYEVEFSSWSGRFFKDYKNLPGGTYTFTVRAKDEAGNVTSVETMPFEVVGNAFSAPRGFRIR